MTLARNITSNWLGLAAGAVISVFLAPLMIHRLGPVFFGLWVLGSSLADYSGLLDTSIRTALFRYIARLQATGDRAALNRTLGNALALSLACSGLVTAILPLVWVAAPHFLTRGGVAPIVVQQTLLFIGLSLAVTFPARALGSYLGGAGRFDLYNVGGVTASIVRGLLIAVLLLRGHGVVAVAVAAFASAFVSLALNGYLLRLADPGARIAWREVSWAGASELLQYSVFALLNLCGESLRSYTDALVIARTLGMALITPFNIATRMVEYLQRLLSAALAPLMARMSEMEGRGERGALAGYLLDSLRWFALACVCAGVLYALDGRALIECWIGSGYAGSAHYLNILMLGYVFALAQMPSQMLLLAIARHRVPAMYTLGEGAANLVLSVFWAHRYGLAGVAWGTTVPLLIGCMVLQPLYVRHVTRIPLRRYFGVGLARPLAVGALVLGLARCGLLPQAGNGFVHLALAAATHATAFLALAAFVCINGSERQSAWRRLQEWLGAASEPIAVGREQA